MYTSTPPTTLAVRFYLTVANSTTIALRNKHRAKTLKCLKNHFFHAISANDNELQLLQLPRNSLAIAAARLPSSRLIGSC